MKIAPNRFFRVIGFAFFALVIFHCGPTPEKLIEKSHAASAREEYEAALLYMKNAYELSLPKEFFLVDRDESFSLLRASLNGEKVYLVEKKTGKKIFEKTAIYFLNRSEGKNRKKRKKFDGKIRDLQISPNGEYAAILQQPTEELKECNIFVWSPDRGDVLEVGKSHCNSKPAVKNDGSVWYLRQDQIHTYQFSTNQSTLFNKGRKPEKTVQRFPAYAYFYASPDDALWLIYGAAGSYRLYRLDQKIKLVSKDIASQKLYLVASIQKAGVFVGGAGVQNFVILDPKTSSVIHSMKAKPWGDAAFLSDKDYYYIEDGVLTRRTEGKEEELPFWAEQLAIGMKGELLFLSSTGSAMHVSNIAPPAEALKIYDKAVEIDDSKS